MDFLKNLSATLSKATEATTKKASELTDTAKLKVRQSRIQGTINDTYTEIGKLIYKQYKESCDESAAIAELCLSIDKSNEELASVLAEIEAIKAAAEAAKAEKAAAKVQTEAAEEAAPEAEEAVAAEEEAEEAPARFCSACGAALAADALFCGKCGQKQE